MGQAAGVQTTWTGMAVVAQEKGAVKFVSGAARAERDECDVDGNGDHDRRSERYGMGFSKERTTSLRRSS